MPERCIICARIIEEETDTQEDNLWDDEEDFIPKPKKKSSSICQLCEAKLRKESDDALKGPKKNM